MQRTAGRWVFVVVTLLGSEGASAGPLRLTMDEAVARATAANLELQATRKDIAVGEASVRRSESWLPANPYLSGGAQRTAQQGVGPNYAFLVSQEFEVAGQRSKRIDAAKQGLAKAVWEAKSAEQNLAANVETAFVQALANDDRVTLAHQSVDAAADLCRRMADQPKDAADTQRMDLNLARIQETRARRDLAAAEQTREATLATLRRLLMLPLDEEIELAGALQHTIRELPPSPELVERALRSRPDLTALHHAVQHADLQLGLLKREAIPNITVSGTLSRFEGDTLVGGDIGLPIPLFHRKLADLDEGIAERERASLQLRNLERTLAQEVLDARRACTVAAADLQGQTEIVPRLEENLRLETRLFDRGEVTTSELIGVQIDMFSGRREQLDALQTYNTALVELERVTGGRLDATTSPSTPAEGATATAP